MGPTSPPFPLAEHALELTYGDKPFASLGREIPIRSSPLGEKGSLARVDGEVDDATGGKVHRFEATFS